MKPFSVSPSLRISTTKDAYVLQHKTYHKRKTGGKKEVWSNIGYYTSLEDLHRGLIRVFPRYSSKTLPEALLDAFRASKRLLTAVEAAYNEQQEA